MKGSNEIKSKRKAREKHYLNPDGTITVSMYDKDIHYLKNGEYEEIDNTLIKQNTYFVNKNNAFHTYFKDTNDNKELLKIESDGYYLSMYLKEGKKVHSEKMKKHELKYNNILGGIDLKYELLSSKVKESLILNNKDKIPSQITFSINTNLELELTNDKTIKAFKDNETIFTIDAPYMFDSNNNQNNNIYYVLNKEKDHYLLDLILDQDWLKKDDTIYPVIIDPTITNKKQDENVYDTYIYLGDTNVNRNSQDILKIGVDRVNGVDTVYRTLLKFDLPTIGTGDEIIGAHAYLMSHSSIYYPPYDGRDFAIIDHHQLTSDWSEETANWNTMNDKYNSRIEDCSFMRGSVYNGETIELVPNSVNVTNLVKKWYSGTPNYGIMLKAHREVYQDPDLVYKAHCFSKNHNLTSIDPKPFLEITYRNQNGLESYMTYQSQSFSDGIGHVNNYNGNLTAIFDIGKTINGKFPVNFNIAYNTNDVVLINNYGYGTGYKLNLHQTIKEITIEENNLLEYLDEDGTNHYFQKDTEAMSEIDNYYDEDGLSLIATKTDNNYIMKDKNNNQYLFVPNGTTWYLREITDTNNNQVIIDYDANNRIISVTDGNDAVINIAYNTNQIVVTSPNETVSLNYDNNKITSLVSNNGTTSFTYDNHGLIERIIDVNGKSIKYEYFNVSPYRMMKISEYSTENNLGTYLNFVYAFSATTVIDNKGRYNTYVFNERGNTVSVTNLNGSEEIRDAYGKTDIFGDYLGNINKLVVDRSMIKYVGNYLTNTSFEKNEIYFTASAGISMSITDEIGRTGSKSLKLISTLDDESITQEVVAPKGHTYTFSAYIKNNNTMKLGLSYTSYDNQLIEEETSLIMTNNDFNRYDVTIDYPSNAISNLIITCYLETAGISYLDDIQLEKGNVANYHNLIDNSNFEQGMTDWGIETYGGAGVIIDDDEIVTLTNGSKALKINADPFVAKTISKTFNISGKQGDKYNISFWYKNLGIRNSLGPNLCTVILTFEYYEEIEYGELTSPELNINDTEWQFFSENFIADKDYTNFSLEIYVNSNANQLYLTNFTLFKDLGGHTYIYDEKGNMDFTFDKAGQLSTFNYDKNNQLINMLNPKGANFNFEYDNNITDRVLRGISPTGISNIIKYDTLGNPILTNITNTRLNKDILDKMYYIRQKGTDKYLSVNQSNKTIILKDDTCSHNTWEVTKEDDYYRIKQILSSKYLTLKDHTIKLTKYDNDLTLFELTKNNNGSYLIKPINSDNYLTINNDVLTLSSLDTDDHNQQFYFEDREKSLFIENKAEYTEDGKYITKTIDTLGNTTTYDINSLNGLTNSITDSKGTITSYTYNDKEQITSVIKEEKQVAYEYNDQDLLSKITHGNKEYNFNYDEFLNIESINIGDNITLITNEYEVNNGNLISSTYGNNHTVEFDYDEFDRIKEITKMNDAYKYYYDNFGNLGKVTSNEDAYKYSYDFAQRIISYIYNNFIINYDYDENSNVIDKYYKLDDTLNHINYTYNEDNSITRTEIDSNGVNYIYDSLGRLIEKNINDTYKINYEYITNGNKTSLILSGISNNNDEITYEYDKLNNITHIYQNDNLINRYEYDNHNQLTREDNYGLNKTIRYIYDISGNILSKREYELNTYNLLSEDKYEYTNPNWEDQLTQYDDEVITYDNIGNPLAIGEDIELTWTNGRELSSYEDLTNTINYKYNKDGIRISKEINNVKTMYYVENNNIIFETTGSNVIYYSREVNGNLIGFKYNGTMYYYTKNAQEDIVGVLDSSLYQVAAYEYDSWGNIISITDGNGNDVSNNLTHIGNINPFRYRSYYYDKETNLYYLNSRYYNPVWGRFVNADGYISAGLSILGYNMYVYGNNNPINTIDDNGNLFKWLSKVGKAISKAVKSVVNTTVKVVKAIANAFVFEVGAGKGGSATVSVMNIDTGISSYQDVTWGIKNGKTYTNVSGKAGADIVGFGVSEEFTHEYPFNPDEPGWKHTPYDTVVISKCPSTQKSGGLDTPITSFSNNSVFIGIEIDAHAIIGGHIKIGWEIDY